MLRVYGSLFCPDCVRCKAELEQAGVDFQYLDFADSLLYLKEFLTLRDYEDAFRWAKDEGKIGIPCILHDDGTITFDWKEYVDQG